MKKEKKRVIRDAENRKAEGTDWFSVRRIILATTRFGVLSQQKEGSVLFHFVTQKNNMLKQQQLLTLSASPAFYREHFRIFAFNVVCFEYLLKVKTFVFLSKLF